MCGRFARYQPLARWCESLGLAADDLFAADEAQRPRYNIAPGTSAWLARADAGGQPQVSACRWAFPTRRGNRINIRSETAHSVPEYRDHFAAHRCVIFANGFYEPQGVKTARNRPWHFFRPRDGQPLFLGGVIGPDGFSILTGAPAAPVATIHDRAPVMIPAVQVLSWLDPALSGPDALQRCAPAPYGAALLTWRVGDAAKNPRAEGSELIATPRQGELF